jgi:hypothetical protein
MKVRIGVRFKNVSGFTTAEWDPFLIHKTDFLIY